MKISPKNGFKPFLKHNFAGIGFGGQFSTTILVNTRLLTEKVMLMFDLGAFLHDLKLE